MKCKISCSFGELIDKVTILKIKKLKAYPNSSALKNIQTELETIQREIPETMNVDPLFDTLYSINEVLWKLEDLIREKSCKKQFDPQYIECADIHKTNDERYSIKSQINQKYSSELKEEKLYSSKTVQLTDTINEC